MNEVSLHLIFSMFSILTVCLFPVSNLWIVYYCVSMFFLSILFPSMFSYPLISDSVSSILVSLSYLLFSFLFLFSRSKFMDVVLSASLFFSLYFFLTDNIVFFFVLFEMSLIPLVFFIILWGRQMERLLATQFMVMFTIISSFPLLLTVISLSKESCSFFVTNFTPSVDSKLMEFSVIAFLVKIPMFLFHSWLPKAHVEAPLHGSMILAGVMLKVGMYGIYKVLGSIKLSESVILTIFSISLVGSAYSLIISMSSDDMKMSVAFSSISHMNIILASLLTMSNVGKEGTVIIMLTHGLSSPILFFLVTLIYEKTNSRSILISKGILSKSTFISLMGLIAWIINVSPPPLLSFLGEVMSFTSLIYSAKISILFIIVVLLLNSFYSILNYGVQCHSSSKLLTKSSESIQTFPLTVITVMVLLFFGFFFPL